MPIKNYYTEVEADRTLVELTRILVQHGASGITTLFDESREPVGLWWQTTTKHGALSFRLPVNVDAVFRIRTNQGMLKSNSDRRYAQARRIAWRNVKDWVDAQMALLEAEQVDFEEIFLPYMLSGGQTLYKTLMESGLQALPHVDLSHQLPEGRRSDS